MSFCVIWSGAFRRKDARNWTELLVATDSAFSARRGVLAAASAENGREAGGRIGDGAGKRRVRSHRSTKLHCGRATRAGAQDEIGDSIGESHRSAQRTHEGVGRI